MAPSRSFPALLALLTLGALLTPLAGAQGGNPGTPSDGAAVLGTDRPTYPSGGPVLFTLHNPSDQPLDLGAGARIDVHAAGGAVVATLAVGGTVPARGNLTFPWTRELPAGTYAGALRFNVTQPMGGTTFSYPRTIWANGSSSQGWTVEGDAPPAGAGPPGAARLEIHAGSGSWPMGQTITFTVIHAGGATLQDGSCPAPRLRVRSGLLTVYDAASQAQACAAVMQRMAPGEWRNLTWDQRDDAGRPVRPGSYVVRADFGGTWAERSFAIEGPAETPPPEPTRRIALQAPAGAVPPGTAVELVLSNTGTAVLEGAAMVQVRDQDGAPVHVDGAPRTRLAPGETLRFRWDQRIGGDPAPGGTYLAWASFADLFASAPFTLTGEPASPTPPPATREPAQPPASGAPAGERPLVGRIGIAASVGGAYRGDWVSFHLDAQARLLTDFRVAGSLVVRELQLPGEGAASVATEPGAIRISAGGATLVVYDTPAGALRLESPGGAARVGVRLADAASADVTREGASIRAPGLDALLLLQGDGRVAHEGDRLQVSLDAPAAGAASPGFVLRAWTPAPAAAPPAARDPPSEPAGAAFAASLSAAIAREKVAAEAYLARDAGATRLSVVPYLAGPVHVEVDRATPREVAVTVDIADPRARTLVFHLGAGVSTLAAAEARVLYDGQPIPRAASLEDALDPDDDGLQAEFHVQASDGGLLLLVSVPHFSVHTISVQGLAEVLPSLAPYGAAGALGLLAVASAYLVRRGRAGP